MPSAHEKARILKKKEAAKAKGGKKAEVKDDAENGTSAEGSKVGSKESTPKPQSNGSTANMTAEEILCVALEEEKAAATEARACTGVLGIHPLARDIKIDNFSVTFYGSELLQDTKVELSVGNR